MILRRLELSNFRNYQGAVLEPSPALNVIIGANGTGKSSILEAVQYACCGRSFRAAREAAMIRTGSDEFLLRAELAVDGGILRRSVSYRGGAGPRVNDGGGPRWLGGGSVLCFNPDDLQLVKGAPAFRRRFLDEAISRRRPAHARAVRDYRQVLSQRNAFLRRAAAGLVEMAEIAPWDRQLAALALEVTSARAEYCRLLSPLLEREYRRITGDERPVRLRLESEISGMTAADDPRALLLERLQQDWRRDLERQSSGTGSHRDDVEISLGGGSIRRLGSQGEQRAAVLSLLLAERELEREGGGAPILLLDDVMSELDPGRRQRLMEVLLGGEGQVMVTAADAGLFAGMELGGAAVFSVAGGGIDRER